MENAAMNITVVGIALIVAAVIAAILFLRRFAQERNQANPLKEYRLALRYVFARGRH